MRYLGIDYGAKRIGLALSDEDGRLAFPLEELENRGGAFVMETIRRIAVRDKVVAVIVGIPMTFGGVAGFQAQVVEKFGENLKKTVQLPVVYENEVLSTKLAERAHHAVHNALRTHRTGLDRPARMVNASSAAIILQSYLDKIKHS